MRPTPDAYVASDDLEVALPGELLPLRRRQPFSQEPQRPALRRALDAVPDEEGSRRSHEGAAARRPLSKAEHGRKSDYPPTTLGKKRVSSAVGSNDRICEV
jgi:hypothetical protein